MDIAALGLSIDSGPLDHAIQSMRQVPSAARAAATGVDQVAGAAERQARATAQSTASLGTNSRAMQVSGSAMRAATAAVNDNAKAMAGLGFQAKQTLVQLPDVIQGIAGGQGVFRTAIQQGGQLVQIWGMGPGGVGGSLRQVGSELAAMITPMRLLGVGIAGIGVAVVAGISSWKNYALALDDLSQITGTATTELSKLQTAASIKGIGQDDFAGGMRRFADAVYDAKAGTNDLAVLLRLNGKTVSDTAGTLDNVAELVRRAKDDQQRLQILQQSGLPATMEWVRLLSSGADGLRAAKEEASKFGGALNDEMVQKAREFDEAWNKAWTNFGISMRRTVVEGYDLLNRLIEQGREAVAAFDKATGGQGLSTVGANLLKSGYGTPLSQNTGQLYGGLMAGQGSAGNDNVRDAAWLAQQQRAIQLEQQRIALLGEAATAADRRREVELRLQAAQLSGINLTEDQKNKIRELAAEERSLAETQKALAVLGASATDDERYAARMQELGIALRHNVINQEQFNRAALDAHPIFGKLKSGMEEFTASMIEGFAKGEDMAKVLENALTSLSSQLIKMGSQNLIGSLFQGVGSAGQQTGGLLGGGLTSLLGLGAAASGGVGALAALGIGAGLSFLGANSAKKQAQQQEQQQLLQAQKAWAGMTDEVTKFTAEMRGVEFGKFANKVISAYNQFTQLAEAANAARDYGSLNQLRASFARFFDRTIAEFRDGVPVLGRVGDAVRDLHNEAESLWEALSIVSGQSADAAVAIQAGLARSLADLTKQVNDELVVKINELTGKGYLNKLGDLFVEMADLARDPALADISQTYFKAAAQDIVNSARLTGDAFNALIEQFPQLQGVVTAFVADAQDSADRLLSYQDRLFSAVTDASTLKGALAAFQRTAQQEIESELAQGGQAINALVAAQEAERFNIIKEFSDRTEKVVQGYKDRLFAATTDTSTLAGALAAFDRTAMREREEEIKAGGESINVLVAAQEAERYNIIKSFSERAAEAQKQALDEATNYLQNFSRRIREYLDSLTGGSQSPLSPTARLSAAQSQFNTQRALAAGGDRNALDSITTYASNLIDAAQAMYGSTTGFQSIFSTVQAQLGALPSQVSPEDVIVQAIETQTTDLENGVLESIRTYLADHLPNIDLNSDNAISLSEMQTALGGSYSTGTLRSIFNELDNDGNGLLTKAELRGTAATDLGSVKTNTGDTKTNTNNTATNTNNTANRIGSGADGTLASILTSMQTANNTAAAQLELLNGQLSAGAFTVTTTQTIWTGQHSSNTVTTPITALNNNMITALNKIVWNTWNTSYILRAMWQIQGQYQFEPGYPGVYADGGLITGRPHSSGGVNINAEGGEYVVNKRDTAWALPMLDAINYGHRMPANDNSGLLSELRALRAEVAALRRDNARVTVAAAEHVRDGIDETNAIHAENNKRLRRQAS